MQITLAVQGKLRDSALKALYAEYEKRLEWKIILQEDAGMPVSPYLIVLDEKGENLTSEAFSNLLQDIQLHHQGKVTFVIGDADGIQPAVKEKATKSISFGRLTWPHLMVRILLMEQLYRAQQILKGHPYHRG